MGCDGLFRSHAQALVNSVRSTRTPAPAHMTRHSPGGRGVGVVMAQGGSGAGGMGNTLEGGRTQSCSHAGAKTMCGTITLLRWNRGQGSRCGLKMRGVERTGVVCF